MTMQGTRQQINDELERLRAKLAQEIDHGGKTIDQMLDTIEAINELELLSTAMAGVKVRVTQ